jgi:alpha/beta hydrolase family protein
MECRSRWCIDEAAKPAGGAMALVRLAVGEQLLLGGRPFGEVGPYTQLSGEAEFAVDPGHPLNQVITDLEVAPTASDGKVHFTADVRILRPANPGQSNQGLFLDVPNRGASVFARMLEPGPMRPATGITEGWLLRRGFTVVTCGWQHDVPRHSEFGLTAPQTAAFGRITGAGFLALRDIVSHVKQANDLSFAIALGGSQSGRLLRHMLYLGACEDEAGALALDGLLPVAAGARMTEANLRFGEPSSNGPKTSDFPCTDAEILACSILRCRLPKVIHLNTSSEYWSSAALQHVSAALCHVTPDKAHDLPLPSNVRMYLCASTQHAPWPIDAPADTRGMHAPNTIDYKPLLRAAVDNLTNWIRGAIEPPPDSYPRLDDGTLTDDLRPAVDGDGNELGGIRHPDISVPLGTYTGWNPSIEDRQTLVCALGSTLPFSVEKIDTRYPSRNLFLGAVRTAAEQLTAERHLLSDDIEHILDVSSRRWAMLHG